MAEVKPVVQKENTFDPLEIRVGRIISVQPEPAAPKLSYNMVIDFGKFGLKRSVGRFTKHAPEELLNRLVVAVLNFPIRKIGTAESEVLVLGTQFPGGESGEATPLSPGAETRIGGKVF